MCPKNEAPQYIVQHIVYISKCVQCATFSVDVRPIDVQHRKQLNAGTSVPEPARIVTRFSPRVITTNYISPPPTLIITLALQLSSLTALAASMESYLETCPPRVP